MEKEFKGRKGEWKAMNIQLDDWSNCSVGVDKEKVICTMYYEGIQIPEEAFANAKLIASAPDLLGALKEAIRLLYRTTEFEVIENYRKKVDDFEKVIDKALT